MAAEREATTKSMMRKKKKKKKSIKHHGVLPSVENGTFETILQKLSQAKKGARRARAELAKLENVIVTGCDNMPPDFVEKVVELNDDEFQSFSDQINTARRFLTRLCANVSRSKEARKWVVQKIQIEISERETAVEQDLKDLENQNALAATIEVLVNKYGPEATVTFRRKKDESDDAKPDDGDDKLHLLDSKMRSREESAALEALAPFLKREEEKEEEPVEASQEEEEEDKKDTKMVWDYRIRAYVRQSSGDDEEFWR